MKNTIKSYSKIQHITMIFSFTIIFLTGISLTNGPTHYNEKAFAQTQNISSVQHTAKGHETHQVIIFKDPLVGEKHKGTITFNLSKPADIMSIEDISNQDTANMTKIWYDGEKIYSPNTLLKNITSGSTDFEGDGLLAHRALNDTYSAEFILSNITSTINNNNDTSNN